MKRVLLSVVLCFSALSAMAVDFTGKYKGSIDGDETIVELTQKGDSITGKVTTVGEDDALSLSAKASGDSFTGTLSMPGDAKLYIRAKLAGDTLKVDVAMDETFKEVESAEFKRQGGAATATTLGMSEEMEKKLTTAVPNKAGSKTLKSGKVYEHSSGGKFRVPDGWKVQETEQALQLIPPGAGQDEFYAFLTASSEGATDPMTQEVVAAIDGQVTQMFPTAKRIGQPQRTAAGIGKGALLVYEAENQGVVMQLRAYITIFKNNAITLVGAGPKAKVLQRDAALREIFASLGWGQGKTDSRLVGVWMYYGYSAASGGVSGGRETKIVVTLKADGTFTYQSNSESSYGTNNGDVYGRNGNGWSGRWTASGRELILHFDDGTSESFTYRFEQQGTAFVMKVTPSGGGKEREFAKQS